MEDLIRCACCASLLTPDNPSASRNHVEDHLGDIKYTEDFCGDCTEEMGRIDAHDDVDHDDMFDVESALGSAGFGTDEYYEGY